MTLRDHHEHIYRQIHILSNLSWFTTQKILESFTLSSVCLCGVGLQRRCIPQPVALTAGIHANSPDYPSELSLPYTHQQPCDTAPSALSALCLYHTAAVFHVRTCTAQAFCTRRCQREETTRSKWASISEIRCC